VGNRPPGLLGWFDAGLLSETSPPPAARTPCIEVRAAPRRDSP
jgi:hypothetical protein